MKKFLIKTAIFFLVLATPLIVLNVLYTNTNFYRSMNELYFLKNHPQQIELLNLGNSHEKAGLRYSRFYDGTAHNFATSSQPFFYDYNVLRHVSDSIAPGATVIIPVSYFDWFYNWQRLFTEDVAAYNKRYYSMLPPQYMFNYDFEEHVKYGILPVLTAKENLKYIREDISLPQLDAPDMRMVGDNIERVARYKANSWKTEVMAQANTPAWEQAIADNSASFRQIVQYCYEQGWTPVVVSLPVTDQLTALFSEEFMAEFDAVTKENVSAFPELLYFDYSRDSRFSSNLEFFRDSDHLNSAGGDALTQQLLLDLAEHGLIVREKLLFAQ